MCQAPFSVLLGTGGTVMNKVDKASTPKLTLQRLCSLVRHAAGQGENRDTQAGPGYIINISIGLSFLL